MKEMTVPNNFGTLDFEHNLKRRPQCREKRANQIRQETKIYFWFCLNKKFDIHQNILAWYHIYWWDWKWNMSISRLFFKRLKGEYFFNDFVCVKVEYVYIQKSFADLIRENGLRNSENFHWSSVDLLPSLIRNKFFNTK